MGIHGRSRARARAHSHAAGHAKHIGTTGGQHIQLTGQVIGPGLQMGFGGLLQLVHRHGALGSHAAAAKAHAATHGYILRPGVVLGALFRGTIIGIHGLHMELVGAELYETALDVAFGTVVGHQHAHGGAHTIAAHGNIARTQGDIRQVRRLHVGVPNLAHPTVLGLGIF